jgi:hypothetical protein
MELMPSPMIKKIQGTNPDTGEEVVRKPDVKSHLLHLHLKLLLILSLVVWLSSVLILVVWMQVLMY